MTIVVDQKIVCVLVVCRVDCLSLCGPFGFPLLCRYTVAGGKMNRGLSLMDVQRSLAKAKGKQLSNKVSQAVLFPQAQLASS